jgi:hypothetical protein
LSGDAAGEFGQQLHHQVGQATNQWHEYQYENPITASPRLENMDDQGQLNGPDND